MEVDLVRLLADQWAVRGWPFSLLHAFVVCTRRGIVGMLSETPLYTLLHLFLSTETWQKEQWNL